MKYFKDLLQKKKPSTVGSKDTLPSKVTDEDVNHIRNVQKDFVSKYKKKPVKIMDVIDPKQVEEMSTAQLKDVIKEAAMEEVQEEKLEKLIIPEEELTTIAPVIEDAINKVSFWRQGYSKLLRMTTVNDMDTLMTLVPKSQTPDCHLKSSQAFKKVMLPMQCRVIFITP